MKVSSVAAWVLAGVAGTVVAAPVEQEVTVESWSLYLRNGADYNLEIKVSDTNLQTGCTAANQHRVFTNWHGNAGVIAMYQTWQSALQYASATDSRTGAHRNKVFIRYDPAICDAARGALLLGVRNFPITE